LRRHPQRPPPPPAELLGGENPGGARGKILKIFN